MKLKTIGVAFVCLLLFVSCGTKFNTAKARAIIKETFELTKEDQLEILEIFMESENVVLAKFKLFGSYEVSVRMKKYVDKGWQIAEFGSHGEFTPAIDDDIEEARQWIREKRMARRGQLRKEVELEEGPVELLLKRYTKAVSMNDRVTIGTMCLEPLFIESNSWKIRNKGEEKIKFISCADLNERELKAICFSLSSGEIANIRRMEGEMHSIDAVIDFGTTSGTKRYKMYLEKYILKDPVLKKENEGRWIIYKFEYLNK